MSRRRAVVFLGMDRIARLLALPEGLRALAVRDDWSRNGMVVLVEGDQLAEQPAGGTLPDLPVQLLDPSGLALQTEVSGWCQETGTNVNLLCPVRGTGCAWSPEFDRPLTLIVAAQAVQMHLIEEHGMVA